MKKIILYILSGLLFAGFFVGEGFAYYYAKGLDGLICCNRLDVQFIDDFRFVTDSDVREQLGPSASNYIGRRLDSLNLYKIESRLLEHNAITGANAWLTRDGVLHIEVSQRAPILRFAPNGALGFYTDENGYVFPLHKDFTADVPVITGSVPINYSFGYNGEPQHQDERLWLRGIISACALKEWKSLVDSCSVAKGGDLLVWSKNGEEEFILGPPREIRSKLHKIEKYYNYIAPRKDVGYYKSINLKYKGQIICRQKDI